MTGNKDSNVDPSASNGGPNNGDDDMDQAWREFMSSHEDDLGDVERSRSARKFAKAAKKADKQAQFDVRDLKADAFATPGPGSGPRDFQGRSWLDTDDVMDEDSTFTPPNPDIGPVRKSTVLFVTLLVIGVVGMGVSILIPTAGRLIGTIASVLTLVGAAGMFVQHRGHTETRTSPFDDGARV